MTRQLTSQELYDLVEVQKLFGESAAEIFAVYSDLGVSFKGTSDSIERIGIESNKIGVNYSKVIKELRNNIGLIDRMSFAKGKRGLEEMAKLAVKTKISMQTVAQLVDKLYDGGIEGAIEMGSRLQMLGGEAAKLGDPLELMYLRGRPEELQKRIAGMAKEFATFNKDTGEIGFSTLGMERMRKIAKELGMDYEELAKSSKRWRKEAEIKSKFDFSIRGKGDFDEILTKVAGIAEFDTNVSDWVVKIGEESKRISELTPDMIGQLDFLGTDKVGDVNERLIKSNESLGETIQRLIDQMKLGIMEGVADNYQQMYDVTREFADGIRKSMESGGMKEIIDFFKDMATGSFQNFMDVYKKIAEGDVAGAGQEALGRIGDAVLGVAKAVVHTLVLVLRGILGGLAWLAQELIVGLGNVFVDIGNSIVWAISGYENTIPKIEGHDIGKFMPDLGDYLQKMKKLMPDLIAERLDKELIEDIDFDMPEMPKSKGMREVDKNNMKYDERLISYRNTMKEKEGTGTGQPTSTTINFDGGFDINSNLLTNDEISNLKMQIQELIRDTLESKNNRGGKNVKPRTLRGT